MDAPELTAHAVINASGQRMVDIRLGHVTKFAFVFADQRDGMILWDGGCLTFPDDITDEMLAKCCLTIYKTEQEIASRKLITAKQASELTDITVQRIYELIKDHGAPGRRIGSTWMIPREAFIQWLADREPPKIGRPPKRMPENE